MNKVGYIHTRECYLAIKRSEGLLHATIWMNLENTGSKKAGHKKPHIA